MLCPSRLIFVHLCKFWGRISKKKKKINLFVIIELHAISPQVSGRAPTQRGGCLALTPCLPFVVMPPQECQELNMMTLLKTILLHCILILGVISKFENV